MSAPIASSSATTLDIEAQTSLASPTPVLTHSPRIPPTVATERNPLDEYFGYTLASSRTHESRHDLSAADVLPPYSEDEPPTYSLKAPEPTTLAQYLFKFGFLFPPFWIMGAWILWSPLRAPSSDDTDMESGWMADKTEAERKRVIEEMRKAEVRWAMRCLWALLILVLLAVIGGIAAWAVLRS
ncbi:hypothetical protein LshimejAT787_0800120 [Lyophyllum shimeji]|uniref:Uncharacterized protein n=1 Tax=Lyophyllum shimeji TaxID=47721 RepID=A0A9P3PRR5_LYOSH|nr:hypothetical protein LshimejAT787_0800120 [Lyophyllum shimeji]